MAERMIGLSIPHLFDGNHDHPDIPHFIEDFSSALYSGQGKRAAALDVLDVDNDFPLRLLLGVPEKELTRTQRLVAETYCAIFFNRPLGDAAGLWTRKPGWQPANPGRRPAPIGGSVLDVDWMLSLGVSISTWEKKILAAPSALGRARQRLQGGLAPADNSETLRHLLMLSVFGFSDPYQFFTAADAA